MAGNGVRPNSSTGMLPANAAEIDLGVLGEARQVGEDEEGLVLVPAEEGEHLAVARSEEAQIVPRPNAGAACAAR